MAHKYMKIYIYVDIARLEKLRRSDVRRTAFRETGVTWHRDDSIEGPGETP